jgi:hypothetical protein
MASWHLWPGVQLVEACHQARDPSHTALKDHVTDELAGLARRHESAHVVHGFVAALLALDRGWQCRPRALAADAAKPWSRSSGPGTAGPARVVPHMVRRLETGPADILKERKNEAKR